MRRDLTKKQFAAAIKRWGFKSGFCGYYELPLEDRHLNVYARNGGDTYRSQLAYLIGVLREEQAKEVTA